MIYVACIRFISDALFPNVYLFCTKYDVAFSMYNFTMLIMVTGLFAHVQFTHEKIYVHIYLKKT